MYNSVNAQINREDLIVYLLPSKKKKKKNVKPFHLSLEQRSHNLTNKSTALH